MLVRELSSHEDKFYEYFRMSEGQFLHILQLMEEDLVKNVTLRRPISPFPPWRKHWRGDSRVD